nr:MAG TPA: hypothetical protein [Caudoviricetes sp.]
MFNNELLNMVCEFIGANAVCFVTLRIFLGMSKTKKKKRNRKHSSPFIDYYKEQRTGKKVA